MHVIEEQIRKGDIPSITPNQELKEEEKVSTGHTRKVSVLTRDMHRDYKRRRNASTTPSTRTDIPSSSNYRKFTDDNETNFESDRTPRDQNGRLPKIRRKRRKTILGEGTPYLPSTQNMKSTEMTTQHLPPKPSPRQPQMLKLKEDVNELTEATKPQNESEMKTFRTYATEGYINTDIDMPEKTEEGEVDGSNNDEGKPA